MKIFKTLIKALLYLLLFLVALSFIAAGAVYYRLIYQEKGITLNSINLEYELYRNSTLNIGVDEISIHANKLTKCLVFNGTNVNIKNGQDTLLTVNSFNVTTYLSSLLKSLSIPIDITFSKPQFFFKNLPIKQNSEEYQQFDWDRILHKAHALLGNTSQQKFLFVEKVNINNAVIFYKSSIYELSIKSIFTAQNQLRGTINMKDQNQNSESQVNLKIDNNKKYINSEIKFNNFPIELITNIMPEDYNNELLKSLSNGLILNGILQYAINKTNNKNALVVNLHNKTSVKIKEDLQNTINQLEFSIITDDDLQHTSIENFLLKLTNNTVLKIKGQILKLPGLLSKSFKINGAITAQNLQINNLRILWPEEVASPVREWFIESMRNGIVKNASCEVNIKDIKNISTKDILANMQFTNVDLKYDKDYDQLNKLTGTASLDGHSAKINITSGELLTSKITAGTVEIIYDEKTMPLIVSATTEGNAKDYLGFIGAENLQLIEEKGLNLSNIQSNLQGKVYVKIPLESDISLANTTLDVNATLKNTNLNFANDFKLSNGDLNLSLNEKSVHVSGPVKINNQLGSIDWISNFDNEDKNNFDHKLDTTIAIDPGSSFEQILSNNFKITAGQAIAKIEYMSYPQNETVNSTIDLSNASFAIPILSLIKGINQQCLFNLSMNNADNKFWQTTKLDLISEPNINITGYAEFDNNLESIRTFNSDLKFMDDDFSIKYNSNNNQSNFLLSGQQINLRQSNFSEMLKKNNNSNNSKTVIDVNLKKVKMPNNIEFNNLTSNFECANGSCTKGYLSLEMGPDAYTKVTLVDKSWRLYTNNAASFLKALNIYKDVEGGELTIDLNPVERSKTKIDNVYIGTVEMNNFTAIKTPILAKLLSFSSFRGILSILQNYKSIPFQKMRGHFIYARDVIRINHTYFTGDFLTLSLNGTLDLKKEYVNFAGEVIPPVYGFNRVLSLVPFIGRNLAGKDGKKGLISASYTIKGKLGNTKTSVNPMSIFLPELIANGLTGFTGFFIP